MNTEIVCALIALTGIVFSGVISWLVSRSSAEKELKKLRLEWAREDVVSSDDEFAEMMSSVAVYAQYGYTAHTSCPEEALSRVAAIRSKESGQLGVLLDDLYTCLIKDGQSRIDELLTEIIQEKRKRKGTQRGTNRQNPKA